MRALLVVHTGSYFSILWPLASRLADAGDQVAILFANPYPFIERDQATCEASAVEVLEIESLSARPGLLWRLGRRVAGGLTETVRFALRLRKLRRLLRNWRAEVVVLGGDIVGYDTPHITEAAHAIGVPVIVYPGWVASEREAAEGVLPNPAFHCRSLAQRLTAALFPRWALTFQGVRLLRLPPALVAAYELCRLAPPSPWILHSGYADRLALESEGMARYARSVGIEDRRIEVTGSLAHDTMAALMARRDAYMQELRDRYDLPAGPITVMAMPPDQLYGHGRPGCAFDDYDALAAYWFASVAEAVGPVLVTLHPSVQRSRFEQLERANLRIARESCIELVPAADLFVASVSSTIQWAIACGVPVVNYDVYHYNYVDYAGEPAVLYCDSASAFEALLARMADQAERSAVRDVQRGRAPVWGLLDGHALKRTRALMARLSSRRARPPRSTAHHWPLP